MAEEKKNPGCLSVLFAIFLGVVAFSIARESSSPHVPPTPEQRAEQARQAAAAGQVAAVLQAIKVAARDPQSVEFSSISGTRDASVVCVEYRARNGFGGLNKEIVVSVKGKLSQRPADWNRHCANKPLDDYFYARRMIQ